MECKSDMHTFYTPELLASNQQFRMAHRCTVGSQLDMMCPSYDSLGARIWAMVIMRVFHGPDVFGWFPIRGDVSFIQFVLSESERWSLRRSFVGQIRGPVSSSKMVSGFDAASGEWPDRVSCAPLPLFDVARARSRAIKS